MKNKEAIASLIIIDSHIIDLIITSNAIIIYTPSIQQPKKNNLQNINSLQQN